MIKSLGSLVLSFSNRIVLAGIFLVAAISAQAQTAATTATPTPQWRPVYHFTPVKYWTNDPNGLIYLNGVYHLYNQQNPFANKWGHMSWGHATSTDLIHWKHLPIALPETIDKDTTWRFSGCAVWDKDNTSGLCKNGACIVIVYTADQPNLKKESQYVAYSNDGGMTFTNYIHNPVIDLHKKDFRDPNVTWNEELKKWVMVVVLPSEHKAQFYSSSNLLKWDLLSEFGPAGYIGANWECPSLIQLPVAGSPAGKKWVLLLSAAGGQRGVFMQYFTGNFSKGVFTNDNPSETVLPADYGDCNYAAIPWNRVPADKKILIGWMMPGKIETSPWKGQMTIPRDLSLRTTSEGLRLFQQPTSVISKKLGSIAAPAVLTRKETTLDNREMDLGAEAANYKNSYWINAELGVSAGATAGFRIAGQAAEIGYDATHRQLYIKKGSGTPVKIDIPGNTASVLLEILVDKSSLEIFINGGERTYTTYIYPEKGAAGLSVFSTGGSAVLHSLTISDLSKTRP